MTTRIAEAGEVWMEWYGGNTYETRRHDPKYPNSPLRIGGADTDRDGNWVVWGSAPSFSIVATESDAVQLLWHMAQEKGL